MQNQEPTTIVTDSNTDVQTYYLEMFHLYGKQIEAHVELITPESARVYLDSMCKNRKKIKGAIEEYSAAIRNKKWLVTHQGIGFNNEGNLIDGQNRLESVIETGISIPMLVVTGCSVKSFAVVDTGRLRKLTHALFIEGVKNYTAAASIVRTIMVYALAKCRSLKFSPKIQNIDGIEFYFGNLDLIEQAVPWAKKFVDYGTGTRATGGFVYYVLATINIGLAEEFLTKLITGVDVQEDDPIVRHRREMETLRRKNDGQFPHRNEQANLVFRTWNRWLGKYSKKTKSIGACTVPYGLMVGQEMIAADDEKVEELLKDRVVSVLG